jgi:flavin reductase (DIM6/NTAB) family NADH-FMN oxidoreductase RutF
MTSDRPETPDHGAFERIVGAIDYPMFVVTTRGVRENAGCLVGFASQTSIHPPRFLVGLSRRNHTYRIACEADHLAAHLLSKRSMELAQLFGGETDDQIDKFARCRWEPGPETMPILRDATAWFVGAIRDRFDLGDHVGHLVEPITGQVREPDTQWLTFADVRELEPGHEA